MRRFVLVAVPCALAALVLGLAVSGAFRGRDPQPAGPPAADGADKSALVQPVEARAGERSGAQRHEPYPFKRVVVIAIGINQYEKLRGTTDLRFAEADAAEVADVCERLYGYEVVRLPREKATKREIELALKRYGRELGDVVIGVQSKSTSAPNPGPR